MNHLLEHGIIEPVHFADGAAPIVPVLKRDGSIRICRDYRVTTNRVAKLDKYPLSRIEASLSGGTCFSKLDLSHPYQQIKLEESREYTTHKGLFRCNRLPFGIASAPSIFQRVMDTLLQGIPGICVYIDDILVAGSTEEEHLARLSKNLKRLAESGMKSKLDKCSFLLSSVENLGHTISRDF